MAAALDDDGELNFVIFFASLCVSEPFDDGDAGDGDSAGDSRSDADDGDGDCCSVTPEVAYPEGPTYTTIMELGPQNHNRDGFFGGLIP